MKRNAESSIAKRCPNGYHKDPKTGQCVDANGNVYQGKQEQPTQGQKTKEGTDKDLMDLVVPVKGTQSDRIQRFKDRIEYKGKYGGTFTIKYENKKLVMYETVNGEKKKIGPFKDFGEAYEQADVIGSWGQLYLAREKLTGKPAPDWAKEYDQSTTKTRKSNRFVKMRKPIAIMRNGKIVNKSYLSDSWLTRFENDNVGLSTVSITGNYRGWQVGESYDGRDTFYFAVNESGYTITDSSMDGLETLVDEYINSHDDFIIQPDPPAPAPQPMVTSARKSRDGNMGKDIKKREWTEDNYDPIHTEEDIANALLRKEGSIGAEEVVKCEYVGTDWAMGSQYWVVMFRQKKSPYYDDGREYGVITAIDWTYDGGGRGIEFYYGSYRMTREDAEAVYEDKIQRESAGTTKSVGQYVPKMPSFRDMVNKMRETRNFKL